MATREKEFITCDMIRDAGIKLAHRIYTEDGFIPDVIYDSLRGGAYLSNIIHEYYKLQALRNGTKPPIYAAVVAHSYGKIQEHTNRVDIDGWTWSPKNLKYGQKILIVDDIFESGLTVNSLTELIMEQGVARDCIKVAVYDYKVCSYQFVNGIVNLPVLPDYWCRKHIVDTKEANKWIHYTPHELIGLTGEEIEAHYDDPDVKAILHSICDEQ